MRSQAPTGRDLCPYRQCPERSMPFAWRVGGCTPRGAQRQLAGRVLHPGGAGRATTAPRSDPATTDVNGRIGVIETKTREPQFAMPDNPPEDNLPEPVALTPEQAAALVEAEERDRQRRLEWAMTLQALGDNSMAVMRAMRQWYPREGDRERQVERVLTSYEDGSFLIDRLGDGMVVDQDLAVVLLDLRRRLKDEYGETPAAVMLIDR